jgi:hypothetical protein
VVEQVEVAPAEAAMAEGALVGEAMAKGFLASAREGAAAEEGKVPAASVGCAVVEATDTATGETGSEAESSWRP